MPDDQALTEYDTAKLKRVTFDFERLYKLTEQYFTKFGFYITSGSLFGGDFLLYRATPDTCHAKYLVLIEQLYSWRDIISAARVANQNNKELLLALFQLVNRDFEQPLVYSIKRALD